MFKGKRGLKTRDPLSPLLFVLSMEYPSRLFKKASTQQGFEYHRHCKKLGMTHLMFIDVLIIFYKALPSSLQILMNAFQEFTNYIGPNVNLPKSQTVFGGDCTQAQQECLAMIGFTEG